MAGSLAEATGELLSQGLAPDEPEQITSRVVDVLVCTHGRRDTCCGSRGMDLVGELRRDPQFGTDAGVRLWRTSHTGGHRFAPTAVLLPAGTMWAWVTPALLRAAAFTEGEVEPWLERYRGCATVGSPAQQAAERAVLGGSGLASHEFLSAGLGCWRRPRQAGIGAGWDLGGGGAGGTARVPPEPGLPDLAGAGHETERRVGGGGAPSGRAGVTPAVLSEIGPERVSRRAQPAPRLGATVADLLCHCLADLGDDAVAVINDVLPRVDQDLRAAEVKPVPAPSIFGQLFRIVVEGIAIDFDGQTRTHQDVHSV